MVGRTAYLSSLTRRPREIIGPGAPDRKTQGIIDISAAAKKAGFIIPEYACITPGFFQRFLDDSGACKAATREEATSLILAHSFTRQEIETLRAAAMLFKPHKYGHLLAVRSGDQAEGLGIWAGGRAYAPLKDEKRLFGMVESTAKEILASDFSDDAIAYKEKKGISGNPGVILSPLYGECFTSRFGDKMFMTPASVNFLGRQNGQGIFSYGPGIGGANDFESPWLYHEKLSGMDSTRFQIQEGKYINMDKLLPSRSRANENEYNMREAQDAFNKKLSAMMNGGVQRYLEFALDSAVEQSWVLTQAANAKIPALTAPSLDGREILAHASDIIGTDSVQTDKVYVSRYRGDDTLIRFNRENNGYLLVVLTSTIGGDPHSQGHGTIFDDNYSLRHFSNAGAVVVLCWDIMNKLASHIGAAKRALGIPILAVKTSEMERDIRKWGFEVGRPSDAKCIVYANEFDGDEPAGMVLRA